jgi:hypothetical protein
LLRSGALYHHRIGLIAGSDESDLTFAGVKRGSFSVYLGDAPIYHFDLEGRWQRAYIGATHYLKSLDTSVHAIDRLREGASLVLRRRLLNQEEIDAFDQRVCGVAWHLLEKLGEGGLRRREPPEGKASPLADEALRELLARITRWDASAWHAHHARYHATYGLLPFLPPDCQNAVVLQATTGNAGGVSFGGGPTSPHSTRTHDEFEQHVEQVALLMGRRLIQTRVALLAGSDVLRCPASDLIRYLELVDRRFVTPSAGAGDEGLADVDRPHIETIHAMLDDFSPGRLERETLGQARRRHLAHVSLGVESGDPEVRRGFGKTWCDDDLRAMTADLKDCGIKISVLTLVGAGGARYGETHVAGTARLIISLELGRGDAVFLLDANEVRDPLSGVIAGESLAGAAWIQQQEQLKQALAPLRERGVKVLPYSLEKQWA